MSAIATKKAGGDRAVQLTFPTVFEYTYREDALPLEFYPQRQALAPEVLVGDDLQSRIHIQRKQESDAMVRAKVQAHKNATIRALTGHQGYHLPKPVLSQRRFANPSFGAYSASSARQDYRDAPFNYEGVGYEGEGLSGGVLRTAQGQAFGKAKLLDRIRQLQEMSQEKVAFLGGPVGVQMAGVPKEEMVGVPTPGVPTSQDISELTRFELFQLLQGIEDSLSNWDESVNTQAVSSYKDSVRSLALIVRVATTGSLDDIIQILEAVDRILQNLKAKTDGDAEIQVNNPAAFNSFLSQESLFTKIRRYLEVMSSPEVYNRPIKERQVASRTALRDVKVGMPKQDIAIMMAQQSSVVPPAVGRDSEATFGFRSDDSSSYFTPMTRSEFPEGSYDVPRTPANTRRQLPSLITREDSEHGYSIRSRRTEDFVPDERQSFGYASGSYFPTGGREVGFFGEAPREYGSAPSDQGYIVSPSISSMGMSQSAPSSATGLTNEVENLVNTLASQRDQTTGEYDVRVGPARSQTSATAARASPKTLVRRKPSAKEKPVSRPLASVPEGPPEAGAPPPRARSVASRSTKSRASSAPSGGWPDWIPTSRAELPRTVPELEALAKRINEYGTMTGKWPTKPTKTGDRRITVRPDSRPKNVRENFYKRLDLR